MENINSERFTNLEIGNLELEALQSATHMHVNFTFVGGKSEFKKITLDIEPINVDSPKAGEVKWNVKEYVIDKEKYEGQVNPKLHYHLSYNKEGETKKIAQGDYKIRILVEHKDGTQSAITKNFAIIKRFDGIEIGENNSRKVELGAKDVHFKYQYLAEAGAVEKILHRLYFLEWRKNQIRPDGKAVTKNNFIEEDFPKEKHQEKNPKIQGRFELLKEFKEGKYFLEISVKEKGKEKPTSLFVPFMIE